jgi:hypothetical protein
MVLLLICVGGCVSRTIPSLTVTPVKLTPDATFVLLPTATPVHQETSTPLATLTTHPVVSPISSVTPPIQTCGENVYPALPPDSFGLDGTIITQRKEGREGEIWLISGRPLTYSPVSLPEGTKVVNVFGFSSDGQWLAYALTRTSQGEIKDSMNLIVRSANGEFFEHTLDVRSTSPVLEGLEYPAPVNWVGSWIDSRLIEVQIYYRIVPEMPKWDRISTVMDPFRGVWQNDIFESLPGLAYDVYEWHFTGISPDQTRVLYNANITPVDSRITLWDTVSQKQLWQHPGFVGTEFAGIQWSPDSSKAVYFVGGREEGHHGVYLVSRDGGEIQEIAGVDYLKPEAFPNVVRWSPDGRMLALTQIESEQLQTTYIYDVESRQYIYQCAFHGNFADYYVAVEWSPDSRSIAISSDNDVYILDLRSGIVTALAGAGRVYGWSLANWKLQP